jgi:hypothetical protein
MHLKSWDGQGALAEEVSILLLDADIPGQPVPSTLLAASFKD